MQCTFCVVNRGLAHLGIIKALTESRIPIDMVGGTSIGAFMGAAWCEEVNHTRFRQRTREWAMVRLKQFLSYDRRSVYYSFVGSQFC